MLACIRFLAFRTLSNQNPPACVGSGWPEEFWDCPFWVTHGPSDLTRSQEGLVVRGYLLLASVVFFSSHCLRLSQQSGAGKLSRFGATQIVYIDSLAVTLQTRTETKHMYKHINTTPLMPLSSTHPPTHRGPGEIGEFSTLTQATTGTWSAASCLPPNGATLVGSRNMRVT